MYMALSFHWNKKRWELLQICLPYCHGPFKNHFHKLWNFITKLWVQIHLKELVKLHYKKIMNSFLFLVTFSYERIFEWNILQFVIKNTCSCLLYHIFCVKECWINMKISKCANFFQILQFVLKNHHNFWIIQKYANYFMS
jgi:hypothetical protein